MSKKNLPFLYSTKEVTVPWHYEWHYNYTADCPTLDNTLHWHDYFEFEIVDKGEGLHIINNNSSVMKRGHAHLLTPYDFHTIRSSNKQYPYVHCFNFTEEALPDWMRETNIFSSYMECEFSEEEMQTINAEINLIKEIMRTPNDELKNHLMSTVFEKILLIFFRKCLSQQFISTPDFSSTTFHKAIAYVQYHFREDIDLNHIANVVGLNPSYLGFLFKKKYGISFKEYLKNIRLKYAKNMLRYSKYSIEEIAHHCGFKTASYFIQCFKTKYDITPKQYIKKYNKNGL